MSGGAWGQHDVQNPFARAVKTAGLPPETTFYALRHTYISRALRGGVPVAALAKMCGTSGQLIERTYGKFIPLDVREWAAAGAALVDFERVANVVSLPRGCDG